jgi:hypothetical protein
MTASAGNAVSLPRTASGQPVGEVGIGRVAKVLERQHGERLWFWAARAIVAPPPGEKHTQSNQDAEHEGGCSDRDGSLPPWGRWGSGD